MITDAQMVILMKQTNKGKGIGVAAAGAGMDEKTARKYLASGRMPSQSRPVHTWRTREDAFDKDWEEVRRRLEESPGLEAKTIFDYLQRTYPGRYADGQLRTLQRKLKRWRATEGPAREVMFEQEHKPGVLCASDFTHMSDLGVTLAGQAFDHMFYHFVLTYSNWETGRLCFSESYESLSGGFQEALWELGGVPQEHRTDRLSAAVNNQCTPEEFTRRYDALMRYYGVEGRKTRGGHGNENGDVEQRHHRFKRAVEQELLMRGSRDFADRAAYALFLRFLMRRLNAGRKARFEEERTVLRPLPSQRLEDGKRVMVRVSTSSTVRVQHNTYSVHSRLIGEEVEARLYAERVEIWYGQGKIDTLPRMRGENRHRINYRHVIDWLVRKPGAFENYRYREEMFPSSQFRMAYDQMKAQNALQAGREYLKVLYLAARENETQVEGALRMLMDGEKPVSAAAVDALVKSGTKPPPVTEVRIAPVQLADYDALRADRAQEEVA